ncbi:hypothetical protein MHA_1595 [Mannheimia haemolytica PHL213]|nr:hypothetical protein MHA_1595 [Mannheimia haemolytica PHL213]
MQKIAEISPLIITVVQQKSGKLIPAFLYLIVSL